MSAIRVGNIFPNLIQAGWLTDKEIVNLQYQEGMPWRRTVDLFESTHFTGRVHGKSFTLPTTTRSAWEARYLVIIFASQTSTCRVEGISLTFSDKKKCLRGEVPDRFIADLQFTEHIQDDPAVAKGRKAFQSHLHTIMCQIFQHGDNELARNLLGSKVSAHHCNYMDIARTASQCT